jgi:hypothetical protein
MRRQEKWRMKVVADGKCRSCYQFRGDSPSKVSCTTCLEKARLYFRKSKGYDNPPREGIGRPRLEAKKIIN